MPRRTGYAPGAPCWVDCITPDLSGAQAFYRSLFGWEFTQEGVGYHLVRLGDEIVGGLGASPPGLPDQALWTTYLATKDADRTCWRVAELGGAVVMGPVPAGQDGRLFLAVDPAGAPVGFWEGHHAQGVVLADEAGAVCGHELRTVGPEQAEAFYGGLFGYRVVDRDGVAELELDGLPCAGISDSGTERPHWLPYFGTAAPPLTVARALSLGARLIRQDPGGPAVLRDPWGARFAVVRPNGLSA